MAIAKDADPEIKKAVNEKAKNREQRQRQKEKDLEIRETKETTQDMSDIKKKVA